MQKVEILVKAYIAKIIKSRCQKDEIIISEALNALLGRMTKKRGLLKRFLEDDCAGQFASLYVLMPEASTEFRSALAAYYEEVYAKYFSNWMDLKLAEGEENMSKLLLEFCIEHEISDEDVEIESLYRAYLRHRKGLEG